MNCRGCGAALLKHEEPGPAERIDDSEWPQMRKGESADDFARRYRRWQSNIVREDPFCTSCLRQGSVTTVRAKT